MYISYRSANCVLLYLFDTQSLSQPSSRFASVHQKARKTSTSRYLLSKLVVPAENVEKVGSRSHTGEAPVELASKITDLAICPGRVFPGQKPNQHGFYKRADRSGYPEPATNLLSLNRDCYDHYSKRLYTENIFVFPPSNSEGDNNDWFYWLHTDRRDTIRKWEMFFSRDDFMHLTDEKISRDFHFRCMDLTEHVPSEKPYQGRCDCGTIGTLGKKLPCHDRILS